jgi:type I restriction enzyme M protein
MAQTKLFLGKLTREELNSLVDRAADLIRTAVDYKFILVLLFLKRLNDVWTHETRLAKERLMKEAGLPEEEAEIEAQNEVYHTLNIPKEFLWERLTTDVKNLPENLANSISQIAKLNKELQGVIDRIDFLEFARNQENRELLRQLIELFSRYDLSNENVDPDVLGDAYEHILMKFAPEKAKEGEVYTPREVIKLLIEILDPRPGQSVYDPACGSGGMLIASYHHVLEKFGQTEARRLFLFGEEKNPITFGLCKMNLMLHDIRDAEIECGDTLLYPKFREDGRLKQFDLVVANPPWNQDGYGEASLRRAELKERFLFGYPPNSSADWAWIQHMLACSREKVGVILDQGALFRGNAEERIRKQVVEKDLVECVILLPEKLFYNTGASGIILILNKNKPPQRKQKILFINATQEFEKHPSVRRLNTLSQKNIERIAQAYNQFRDNPGFSKVASLEEVRSNNYNLNVPLYVSPLSPEEEIDLKEVYSELRKLRDERETLWSEVEEYINGVLKL